MFVLQETNLFTNDLGLNKFELELFPYLIIYIL